jgi:hypothetical protein
VPPPLARAAITQWCCEIVVCPCFLLAKDTGRNRVVRFTKDLWEGGTKDKDY